MPSSNRRLGVTMKGAMLQSVAVVISALLGAVAVIYTSGRKMNVSLDVPPSFWKDLGAGLKLATDPSSASNKVQKMSTSQARPIPCPPLYATGTVSTEHPMTTPISPDPGLNPDVLKRCSGMEPLVVKRLFVTKNQSGYHALLEFMNPTDASVISLLSQFRQNSIELSTEHETVQAQTGLLQESMILAQGNSNPDAIKAAFLAGMQIKPKESTSISVDWPINNASAEQAQLSTHLFYVVSDENGQQTTNNRGFSCSGIPIYNSSK